MRARAYDRERAKSNPERRAQIFSRLSEFAARSPIARAAHIKTGNAIRDGRLKKGACENCGSVRVLAHHDDYLKPLQVRWLCQPCHVRWHIAHGPGLHRDMPLPVAIAVSRIVAIGVAESVALRIRPLVIRARYQKLRNELARETA